MTGGGSNIVIFFIFMKCSTHIQGQNPQRSSIYRGQGSKWANRVEIIETQKTTTKLGTTASPNIHHVYTLEEVQMHNCWGHADAWPGYVALSWWCRSIQSSEVPVVDEGIFQWCPPLIWAPRLKIHGLLLPSFHWEIQSSQEAGPDLTKSQTVGKSGG